MIGINHNQVLAEAAARHLRETGAENYTGAVFTVTFAGIDEQIEVLVTTQKVGALTPHDLRIKAETEREAFRIQLTEANNLLKKLADIDLSASDFDFDHWQYLLSEVSLQLTTTHGASEDR